MAQTRHLVLGLMPRGADPDTHWAAGPWCFDTEEDFFPGWEDSFVFGREPLRDPATLDRAVLMAQSLTVDSIPALGRHLLDLQRRRAEENNPVSTLLGPDEIDLPGVYWETLLTPWACTVARQLVERWLRVRAMVEDGRLSNGHARTILPLSPALQEKAADAILKSDLSVRQTELLVKKLTAQEKAQPAVTTGGLEVNYAEEAAKSLGAHLGRGCKIVSGRKKGRIELEYYGVDDLNNLLDALNALTLK